MDRVASKKKVVVNKSQATQIEDNLERQNITFDALFRLFEKLGTTFDVKKIVRLFLMTLMGQLKLKRVSLYLVLPGKNAMELYHSLGCGNPEKLPNMRTDAAIVRWLKMCEGPTKLDDFFITADATKDDEEELMSLFRREGFLYAITLTDQEDLVGVLFYSGQVTGEDFNDFENELLKLLVRVATITIKNAWLYQMAVLSKLELEKFTQVKKEFISHTSHELRTPLTVLKSALWSIEPDEIEGGVMVNMARDAVLRLQNKIEYLLSLNDIELNKMHFNMELTDVTSLFEDTLREVIPELEEKGIKVNFDDRTYLRKVRMDAGKIKVVLQSIIDNAIDSVDMGGHIDISASLSDAGPRKDEGIEIGDWDRSYDERFESGLLTGVTEGASDVDECVEVTFQRGIDFSYLVIRIKDDGIGIPPEEINTLSEPFRRASNSVLKNVKGLGIGLSVSQKIVAGHGGKIFCRSAEGEGAEFAIWLPVNE